MGLKSISLFDRLNTEPRHISYRWQRLSRHDRLILGSLTPYKPCAQLAGGYTLLPKFYRMPYPISKSPLEAVRPLGFNGYASSSAVAFHSLRESASRQNTKLAQSVRIEGCLFGSLWPGGYRLLRACRSSVVKLCSRSRFVPADLHILYSTWGQLSSGKLG